MSEREPSGALDAFVRVSKGLGLTPGSVSVEAADPTWADSFTVIHSVLSERLGDVAIEHVGSTSVPGLAAKPMLDVALGLPAGASRSELIEVLEQLGFSFQGDLGAFGGLFFTLCDDRGRVIVHAHAVDLEDPQWRRYLGFRDHLRAEPDVAAEYAALKQDLAGKYADDRAGYTEAKFDWVVDVVLGLESGSSEAV